MSNYEKHNMKIKFKCKLHDTVYSQVPYSFLHGLNGCTYCQTHSNTKKTTDEFSGV